MTKEYPLPTPEISNMAPLPIDADMKVIDALQDTIPQQKDNSNAVDDKKLQPVETAKPTEQATAHEENVFNIEH